MVVKPRFPAINKKLHSIVIAVSCLQRATSSSLLALHMAVFQIVPPLGFVYFFLRLKIDLLRPVVELLLPSVFLLSVLLALLLFFPPPRKLWLLPRVLLRPYVPLLLVLLVLVLDEFKVP